ncbi:MAG: urate hydroxylase PuuD [Congregibacter sp.]|nr:urate hydroxylase PuuD [Congregibacter sp.]
MCIRDRFHVLAGIVWIGMLYYFNFVQTEYFKEAEAPAKADAMKKLAPRALKWFRYGALVTFITGLALLHYVGSFKAPAASALINMGALAGTLMFLNVWLIIWPKQQIVLGMKEGDGPAAAAKAGLASRTNTLFSGPMLLGMLGSKHLIMPDVSMTGLIAACGLIVLLQLNAMFGRMGPMASVVGVVHLSILLAAAIWALLAYL